jgi:acyl phosphate:glycerol-3-phosphate acyltransferase
VVGYLLGTLPTAALVAGRHGVDPMVAGSGNPGATNVMRTVGARAGALTLVGDVGKGVVAAGLGWAVGDRTLAVVCGTAAVVGHVAPVTRRLRGGKGVATGFGMALTVVPLAALAAGVWFYAVRGLVGRPSALSEMGIVALPVVAWAQGLVAAEVAVLGGCAGLVLVRLWTGRERPVAAAAARPTVGEADGR